MTRLERKEAELEKLYEYRAAAMRKNDFMWMSVNQKKIDALEKEVIELRGYEPRKLSEMLRDRPAEAKARVFKALLRISLLADVVNEACETCNSVLKEYGLSDFSFRQSVKDLARLSYRIATVPVFPGNDILEDFIVNDDEVVEKCVAIADDYLAEKLKL